MSRRSARRIPDFVATGWAISGGAARHASGRHLSKVSDDLYKATSKPELQAKLGKLGSYARPMKFAEAAAFAQQQQKMWNPVLADIVAKQPKQ